MSEAIATPEQKIEPLSAVEATELQYLDPAKLAFSRHGTDLRLIVDDDRCWLSVSILRIFPLSTPDQFLSIRTGDKKEVGIIVDPAELNAENRRLVTEDLGRRYLVSVIQRIIAIKERFGTLDWDVETNFGQVQFTTRNVRDNLVQPTPERYILTDVDSNRYDIPDIAALDAASYALLMRHM